MPQKQKTISKEIKAEEIDKKKAKPAKNSSTAAVDSVKSVAKPTAGSPAVAKSVPSSSKEAATKRSVEKSPASTDKEVSSASVVKPEIAPAKQAKEQNKTVSAVAPPKPVKKPVAPATSKVVPQANEEFSSDKLYSTKHLWVKPNTKKNTAYVGITDYLAEELVAIDNVDLPIVGDEVEMESFCAHLYSHNRVHHVRSPLTGRILEVNQEVQDSPSLLHLAPEKNWLFLMEYDEPDELDMLISGQRYAKFLDQRC